MKVLIVPGEGGKMITGPKLQAARILLGWTDKDLARKSKVSLGAVVRAENSEGEPIITIVQLDALVKTLGAAGVEFITEDGGGHGVRLGQAKAVE